MAMDYWETTEMEEANMSMDELWKRRLTPMVCGKCLGSHRTVDCGAPRWDQMGEDDENLSMEELFRRSIRAPLICGECGDPHKTTDCKNVKRARTGEPNENWTMQELEEHYSSSRKACEFWGYPQESQAYTSRDPPYFPWSYNGSYQNLHNPYVYQEEFFGLQPLSPENHNQLEEEEEEYISREKFEELKESAKGIEVAIGKLVKLMECQPQESMPSQREECPNEPTIEIHTKDEEEEFAEEMNGEGEPMKDLDVRTCVYPISTIVEPHLNLLTEKKILVELDEQEEGFSKIDFVVEFLPEQYLKNKRQKEIEFILRFQDQDRTNKRSRKEKATPRESRRNKVSRTLRECIVDTFEKEPGTMKEHDPDTMPFDPGG